MIKFTDFLKEQEEISLPVLTVTQMGNNKCIEMDEDTYEKCIRGKIPFARWSKYIPDEEMRNEVIKMYRKHKSLFIKNAKNGTMVKFK